MILLVVFSGVSIFGSKGNVFFSSDVWCNATGNEVSCGGSGKLAHEVVRNAGAYPMFTRAHILDGIETIGNGCFSCCRSLREVDVSSSVLYFEKYCFSMCSIASFTFGRNVISINARVFNLDTMLMSITVDPANANYCSVDGMLLTNDGTKLIITPYGLNHV